MTTLLQDAEQALRGVRENIRYFNRVVPGASWNHWANEIDTVLARLEAAKGEIEYAGIACCDCGFPYGSPAWIEAVVSHDIWNKHISPNGDGSGILCINCMAQRAVNAGLSDVPVKLVAGPFLCSVEPLIRGAIDETRELVAALPEELFTLRKLCRAQASEIVRLREACQAVLESIVCENAGTLENPFAYIWSKNWVPLKNQIDAALSAADGR